MADVFISYSREDVDRAIALQTALTGLGLSVWRDESVQQGADFEETILDQITSAGAVIVCWSDAAAKSKWVRREAREAERQNKYVGCQIAAGEPGFGFDTINNANLAQWQGDTRDLRFLTLVSEIGQKLGKEQIASLHGAEIRRLEAEKNWQRDAQVEKERQEQFARQLEEARRHAVEQKAAEQRRRTDERRKSLAQKIVPWVRPYCVWANPILVALTIDFFQHFDRVSRAWQEGIGYAFFNGYNFGYNILPAYIASWLLWRAMLRPGPVALGRYMIASLLQWPLTWLLFVLVEFRWLNWVPRSVIP